MVGRMGAIVKYDTSSTCMISLRGLNPAVLIMSSVILGIPPLCSFEKLHTTGTRSALSPLGTLCEAAPSTDSEPDYDSGIHWQRRKQQ